ncbi:MAG TPA: gluconokinase [Nocardioides sp.]|nr:gluconokinase [Nocardioides sp.]
MPATEPAATPRHRHVVVMGVSGTGKSTVGRALATRLGMTYGEGDDLHPAANIAKMAAGVPLDDADRAPWLAALAAWTSAQHEQGRSTVLTCSALRRSYRDLLRSAVPERTVFVHLVAPADVLTARMASRTHFMPPSLLSSQLRTLEPLGADEAGSIVDVTRTIEQVVDDAAAVVEQSA